MILAIVDWCPRCGNPTDVADSAGEDFVACSACGFEHEQVVREVKMNEEGGVE